MKNSRSVTKNDLLDVRVELSNYKYSVPKSKLSSGSLSDKYPVILDGGKTIIFISDQSKEAEAREKYELRKTFKNNSRSAKFRSDLPLPMALHKVL
ncbi:MAG: hypothetical protein ACOYNC_15700 [Bacteroidales bacterium]